MKVIHKNISKLAIAMLIFVFALGAGKAHAQTHNRAAANCVQHEAYLKETSNIKNAVSCVDCYCKVCGDKKAKEKEAKRKAQELADAKQKAATPKTTTTATKKTKSDEVVLVVPKPKTIEQNKVSTVKLSAQDQEIFELTKMHNVKISGLRDYNGNGKLFFLPDPTKLVNSSEPTGRIFYEENDQIIILKDLRLKDNAAIGYNYGSNLDENGNFCLNFGYNDPAHISQSDGKNWADIVTLEGENLLNDKTIENVVYKGNCIYELKKRGEKTSTLKYDFKTKKIRPLN